MRVHVRVVRYKLRDSRLELLIVGSELIHLIQLFDQLL